MRSHAEAVQRLDDADRAEQVHLDCVVDRRVERHRRRGVDDDLAGGECLATRVVEPESVGAHVTADHCDPARDLLVEAVTEDRSQRVERVVADDLALHALRRGRAATRADEEHEGAVGHGAQEPLHDCGAEEPGGSGDGDAPAGEGLLDHRHQYLPNGRACLPTGRDRLPIGRQRVSDSRSLAPMATSDRILDVALASFGTRGYEASSLDSIAGELGVRKQTILYYFPTKEALLAAVIDRSARELSAALEDALVRAGEGWARVEAVVRSVFRLALRRPELLGLLREVSRLGPPPATRLTEALDPLVQRARLFLEAEMDNGTMRRQDARLVLLSAYSAVIGVATEVEVLRAVGIDPTLRSLAMRRRELLGFLRSALIADAA